MRSENKLKVSYDKQKALFDAAKVRKTNNLLKKKKEISLKIQKLQAELAQVSNQIQENNSKEFPSFEEFKRTAANQAEQARASKN